MTITLLLLPMLIASSACRILGVPFSRDTAMTHLVATALPDTVAATAGEGPTRYGLELLSLSTPPGLRPPVPAQTRVFGQLVLLDDVGGFRATEIQSRLARGTREAVLVPWGYQADCSPILWDQSAQWIVPAAVGFFVAQLRPEAQWLDGRPTFDVGAAWHQPYPHGEFLRYDRPSPDPMPELTVAQLWTLYENLPRTDSLYANPTDAIEPARRWARANPDLAARWPATQILDILEYHVENQKK